MQLFRLKWYNTKSEEKFDIPSYDYLHEYLGDANSVLTLYYLIKDSGFKHVEVYNLSGQVMDMTKGSNYLKSCS